MTTTNLYQLPMLRLIKYMQMRKYKYFISEWLQSIRGGCSSWLQNESCLMTSEKVATNLQLTLVIRKSSQLQLLFLQS